MKSKKQFWNTGVNPILGYRYESLGQQVYSAKTFYSQYEEKRSLCTQ